MPEHVLIQQQHTILCALRQTRATYEEAARLAEVLAKALRQAP